MSDFYHEITPFWHPRGDAELAADQAEADRADAKHEARLDRRDRDLPLERLPVPVESTGLCTVCRGDMALPESDWCSSCSAEIFGDAA